MQQHNGLELDLNLDSFLRGDLSMARYTAAPRSRQDLEACLLACEAEDMPWWVTDGEEPGCLFNRQQRRRRAA